MLTDSDKQQEKKETPRAEAQVQTLRSREPLFKCNDLVAFNVGQGNALIYSKTTDSAVVGSVSTALLLKVCEQWRTLADHADELVKQPNLFSGKSGSTSSNAQSANASKEQLWDSIMLQLKEAVTSNLLVSDTEIYAALDRRSASENLKISSIGFLTRNRSSSLERCITSYINNAGDAIDQVRLLVMDDSDTDECNKSTRKCLQKIKKEHGCRIAYADTKAKAVFIERLHKVSEVPLHVVRFGLSDSEKVGHSTGANRNCLLLQTVGELGLSADDDTVCQVYRDARASAALRYSSQPHIAHMKYFKDRDSALAAVVPVECNILSVHEQLLGHQLGAEPMTVEDSSNVDVRHLSTKLMNAVCAHAGRVALTLPGRIGDSASTSNLWVTLFAEGIHRESFLSSADEYLLACTSREALRCVHSPLVVDQLLTTMPMSTVLGYDNRTLLPPFLPVLRSQDNIFRVTMQKCFADAFYGYLPEMVMHAPMETRMNQWEELWQDVVACPLNYLVLHFVSSARLPLCKPERALSLLGEHFMSIGSQSMKDFVEYCKFRVWQEASSRLTILDQKLQIHQQSPEFWACDVRKYRDLLVSYMLAEDLLLPPSPILKGRTKEEAMELTRTIIFKFGELLHWWPHLHEAAHELKSRGQELVVEL